MDHLSTALGHAGQQDFPLGENAGDGTTAPDARHPAPPYSMPDSEADSLLLTCTDVPSLARVMRFSPCHGGRNQGSNWCRACEARRRLEDLGISIYEAYRDARV